MKKILLLCILLSSFAMARFDCCARKRATIKKQETSLTFSVGVVRDEDESLLKKASSSLAKGFVDGLYIDSLWFNSDSDKKEVLLRLKKEIRK